MQFLSRNKVFAFETLRFRFKQFLKQICNALQISPLAIARVTFCVEVCMSVCVCVCVCVSTFAQVCSKIAKILKIAYMKSNISSQIAQIPFSS